MGTGSFLGACSTGATEVLRTLRRREDGHSAVEYVFLLAFIVASGVAGAHLLSGTADRALALVTGAMSGGADKPSQNHAVGSNATGGQANAINLARLDIGRASSWSAGVFTGLLASLAALGWIIVRRRKPRHHAELQPVPESQFAESDLHDRFFEKRQNLLRLLSKDGGVLLRNRMQVRHLMTTECVVVPPGMPRAKVNESMRESRVRHLLVCDASRRLLGVVSDRDLHDTSAQTAADLMTTRIQTVASDTPLSPAITHLVNEGISCLPVVDDGHLRGILTTTDLILALQCTLQLWLHAAETMHSEAWEQEMIERARSQAYAADPNTCRGLKSVFETLMNRADTNLETAVR